MLLLVINMFEIQQNVLFSVNLLSMVHYSAVSSAESKHKSGWASQRGSLYTDCQDTTLLATNYKKRRGGPPLELRLSQMIEPKLKFYF